jgi:hypothetical protein
MDIRIDGQLRISVEGQNVDDTLVVTFYALKDHECVARAKTMSGWVVTD